jgi:hypothetical protein
MNRAENAKEMEEHEENVAGKPARGLPSFPAFCPVFSRYVPYSGKSLISPGPKTTTSDPRRQAPFRGVWLAAVCTFAPMKAGSQQIR